MASFSTGGFTLSVSGRTVPLASVSPPEMPRVPTTLPAFTIRFRIAEWVFEDPVDRELVELGVLDRAALGPMSPDELREARHAAGFDVFVDRLMSSVRIPRRR